MKTPKLFTLTLLAGLFCAAAANAQNPCAKTDYPCKIKLYRGQIEQDPNNLEAYYSLGSALLDNEEYQAAIAPLDHYISDGSAKPEYIADAYNLRGWAQYKLGRQDAAVADYSKAIELFPKAHMYYNRGHVYSAMKQYAKTVADDTKAIGLDPKYRSAYFDRGYANMEMRNNPPAIADFTKVLELDPDDVESWYNRGTIYYRQKEYASSVKDLDKYLTLSINNKNNMADGYLNRGLAKYYLGNTNEAIGDFTRAIDLIPTMKNAYTNRAIAYRKAGKAALAEADEQKAAALE